MKKLINDFPNQIVEALEIGRAASLPSNSKKFQNVLISGLGGSGIGGAIISQIVGGNANVPILNNNDYTLPGFCNENTLVIISSYSGNTEETVAAMELAIKKGCQVVCVTSGGKVEQIANDNAIPKIMIPGGNPPRSMFAYSSVQLLYILRHYGIIDLSFESELERTVDLLNKEHESIVALSKDIAKRLAGRIPVLYSESRYSGVAVRWRQQINENSKMLCWHHSYPEMNHNELVGWSSPENRIGVLVFRNEDDHERTKIRMEICDGIFNKNCDTIINLNSKGDSQIERSYYLINLGDWVSWYLSVENNVDAVEITNIIYLKSELEKI